MFVSVVPGMAGVVAAELARLTGVRVTDQGFDGRSDLILFEVDRGHRDVVWSLRTIEDLFVEVGRTRRSSGDKPHWIASRIWRPERVERALSIWASDVRPLAAVMTYRTVARVLEERSFLRTELRAALNHAIAKDKPRWRLADPAEIEVWISEFGRGNLVAGLRLSDVSMRQRGGRVAERSGALRPSVAAAMTDLAGRPRGRLVDPCCGSGTILAEALAGGWDDVYGIDVDPEAVKAVGHNVPDAQVHLGDARHTEFRDSSVAAIVSNLPFGKQYEVQGSAATWLHEFLTESARVLRPGGRAVLLVPRIAARSIPSGLRLRSRDHLRLLGMRTALWVFDRL